MGKAPPGMLLCRASVIGSTRYARAAFSIPSAMMPWPTPCARRPAPSPLTGEPRCGQVCPSATPQVPSGAWSLCVEKAISNRGLAPPLSI